MNRWLLFVVGLLLLAPLASAEVVLVDLGNEPPPAMVGPYPMTAASLDGQEAVPEGEPAVGGLPMEVVNRLSFSQPLPIRRTVPTTWPAWGNDYQGPVFHFEELGEHSGILRFEPVAFYFYVRPRGSRATIEVAVEGQSTGPIDLQAEDGPRGFAFYGTDRESFRRFTLRLLSGAAGLGIAQFGAADETSTCSFGIIELGQTVEGQWTDDCGSSPGFNAQFFTFDLEETTAVEAQLAAADGRSAMSLYAGQVTSGLALGADFSLDPSEPAVVIRELEPGTYTLAVEQLRDTPDSPRFTLRLRELAGLCQGRDSELCIDDVEDDQRFAVNVAYQSVVADRSGPAQIAVSNFDRGGIFYFFDSNNPEVMVKVLRGCPVNGHFWIFVSAVTNVGVTVTVEDTLTGEVWTYENPDQNVALPVQDLRAFACDEGG